MTRIGWCVKSGDEFRWLKACRRTKVGTLRAYFGGHTLNVQDDRRRWRRSRLAGDRLIAVYELLEEKSCVSQK
ncbi:hypothetical protein KAR91_10465 [Candidatus Pacearchaeota archaeon]|nr:hypothetical protein [Candidatus Pacearchaeota archaeon]